MFKAKWDPQFNSILLDSNIDERSEIIPPRPVFLQELQLLEINKDYDLTITDAPLCWCDVNRYYYKGILFFERKGASIYKKPTIIYNEEFPYKKIEPVDVNHLIDSNIEAINTLENEAMDFIQDCYERYNNKVDDVVVAFSGGKDSQVILDLVSRVIPAENYKAVFQDTDMELPCTYEIVQYTEEDYKYKFPNFKMYRAYHDRKAIDLWKQYGPPSRVNRWCCSVMKTAAFRRLMKEIHNTDIQPKAVVFEGVRADESARRESYDRIGENVKHPNLINCRAIFKWNDSEVFLYMLYRNIVLNPAYRYGLTRVGCGVCPFASDWSEYVIRRIYPDISKMYVGVIEEMGRNLGLKTQKEINNYIDSGNWQKNAGGRGLETDGSRIDIVSKSPNFECVVSNPKTDWRVWLTTLGKNMIYRDGNEFSGELNYKGEIIKFRVVENDSGFRFFADGVVNKNALIGLLSRVLTKTASCELCGVCEAECPTGALSIRDKVSLIDSMCVHCHKCLEVSTRGCIIAQRKQVYEGGSLTTNTNTRTSGLDKYSTFGLRDEWLTNFFEEGNEWFGKYTGLGVKMIPATINWLREAELIDAREKKVSTKFEMLGKLYSSKPLIIWQLIWVGLSFNSAIINSFVTQVAQNVPFERDDIVELIREVFPNLNTTTIKNPINATINMFNNSPLGHISGTSKTDNNICICELEKKGNTTKRITRIPAGTVSLIAYAYLLYKMAEKEQRYTLTVSELIEEGKLNPYTVFGCETDQQLKMLRSLSQMNVLNADLLGGLENIHLDSNFKADDILDILIKRL